jgi:hypothetical protein
MSLAPLQIRNQRFGLLVALEPEQCQAKGKVLRVWRCICDCGNTKLVRGSYLTHGLVKSCGCLNKTRKRGKTKRFRSLVNKRFERLLVLAEDRIQYQNKSEAAWKCLCDCGKVVLATSHALETHHIRSCGCLKIALLKIRDANLVLPEKQGQINHVIAGYQRAAAKRNLEWALTGRHCVDLLQASCHWCGSPPNTKHKPNKYQEPFIHSGIDRLDSSKGYTINNCVSACWICNRAKGTLSEKEFIEWIYRLQQKQCGT